MGDRPSGRHRPASTIIPDGEPEADVARYLGRVARSNRSEATPRRRSRPGRGQWIFSRTGRWRGSPRSSRRGGGDAGARVPDDRQRRERACRGDLDRAAARDRPRHSVHLRHRDRPRPARPRLRAGSDGGARAAGAVDSATTRSGSTCSDTTPSLGASIGRSDTSRRMSRWRSGSAERARSGGAANDLGPTLVLDRSSRARRRIDGFTSQASTAEKV